MKAPLPLLAIALAACGGSSSPAPPRPPDEYDSDTAMGCATDENATDFDNRETSGQFTVDDAQAPRFTLPMAGDTLALAPVPTFAWQPTPSLPGRAHGDASCEECPICHLPPVSGDVYDLQFTVDGAVAWRIVYSAQQWTPKDVPWKAWAGKTVSLVAYRMLLKANDVQQGPFRAAQPLVFHVAAQ